MKQKTKWMVLKLLFTLMLSNEPSKSRDYLLIRRVEALHTKAGKIVTNQNQKSFRETRKQFHQSRREQKGICSVVDHSA